MTEQLRYGEDKYAFRQSGAGSFFRTGGRAKAQSKDEQIKPLYLKGFYWFCL